MLVLTIIILFYIFKKGIKTARFLLFAMLPVFLMHIFIILNKFGILDQNFILMWGTKISVSWMFLLFTFSLFDRISLINARLRKNEDMLESASTGILTFDLNQKLTYVNNSLLDMWGYDNSDEVIGCKVTDLLGDKKHFNKSMKVLEGYAKQITLHLKVEKEQLNTQKKMQLILEKMSQLPPIKIGSLLARRNYEKVCNKKRSIIVNMSIRAVMFS